MWQHITSVPSTFRPSAVLLNRGAGPQDVLKRVATVLDVLGVPSCNLDAAAIREEALQAIHGRAVICSASAFLEARALSEAADPTFGGTLVSAFVYADCPASFTAVARLVTTDVNARLAIPDSGTDVRVSTEHPQACGPLSGMTIQHRSNSSRYPVLQTADDRCSGLLTCDDGVFLGMAWFRGLQVYLCTASTVVDLDSPAPTSGFDVREQCLESVPLVLYTRATFPDVRWKGLTSAASLVIDDPLLKPRYGCIEFAALLQAMDAHDFSSTIAFIPWNWRRSHRRVARMFRERPDRLSLVVHGCDHTRSEFGTANQAELSARAELALERMARHQEATSVPCAEVMVFPQGVFSADAPRVLKEKGFVAAVNSDVWSADGVPRRIPLRACWDVAVMDYGEFPIFTRRYPGEGVENVAWDLLLGKPAISVIHQDYCVNGYEDLVGFVKGINALSEPPAWLSLGELVRRSGRARQECDGTVHVEMYGTELWFRNERERDVCAVILRRESNPAAVKAVWSNAPAVEQMPSDDRWLRMCVTVPARFDLKLKVSYHDNTPGASNGFSPSPLKVMARRYLSEIRDRMSRNVMMGRVLSVLRNS